MSMIGVLQPLTEEQLEHILGDAKNIRYYLYGDTNDFTSFWKLLLGKKTVKPDTLKLEWAPLDDSQSMDLDKAWNGIHYLLTGTGFEGEWPFNFILAGQDIGDQDVGYGPARGIHASQVREISEALKPLTKEELMKRFDPKKMMELEIYPTIWDRDPKDDDTLGYLMEYYGRLKTFIHQAAENHMALILYIC
jgi:hypothetical protein